MPTAIPITAAFEDMRWLQRFAQRLANDADEAQDLVQETLVEAWRDPPADREAPLRPWLAGVMRNRLRMRVRGQRRREEREKQGPVTDGLLAPDAEHARLEVLQSLLSALRKLPDQDQRIVVRRFFNDESATEIGSALDMQPATVRSRIHRSLKRLRQSLDRRFGDRSAWCAAVLTLPSGSVATTTTGSKPMMSLTAKILLTATAGTVGVAGWFATQDEPSTKPATAARAPATAMKPKSAATTGTPRARWEERRTKIRAVLPETTAEGQNRRLPTKGYREILTECIEDLESEKTGALTLNFDEIGAPDIGVVYDSIEVAHTNYEDAEVLECLTESMYAFVGEAPDEAYAQSYVITMPLGETKTDAQKEHQSIGYIVGAHISEVRFCESKGEGDVRGSVAVAMTMGEDGKLATATAGDTDLSAPVVDCIVNATKRWKFPESLGGKSFDYTFQVPVPGKPPGKHEPQ